MLVNCAEMLGMS